jgi:serine/threonine-protein kinase RsbW
MRSETSFPARVENLPLARAFVERACLEAGADPSVATAMKLAVDEACSNVIEHGYAGRADGAIGIVCEADGHSMRVTLVDRGRAFSPESIAPADTTSDWKDRPIGGLGWHLIRRSVDDVDYRPDPARGNRLTLVKRLADRRP